MASDTELWRGTDYGWWLAADTSGAVGASLIAFAVPLMMLATTGSSAAATTTESICVVVQAVLGLAGGVIQDRYDRRTLMLIWGASGVVLSAVAAAAVMLFGNAPKTSGHGVNGANAPAFGGPYAHVLPIALLCIVVLFSVRDGLLENTSNAMLRGVVPDEQLPHAMALNDARDSTVTLAGGPLGGLLMTVGHAVPFLTSAVLSVLSMVSAWRIRRYWKRATVDDSGHSGNADDAADDAIDVSGAITAAPRWRDALDGMIWLLRDRFQRHLIIAATMVTGASNAFLLLTALDISQGGSQLISAGFINAASAVGMLLGALMASQLVNRVPGGVLVGVMFALLAAGFTGAALVPSMVGKAIFVACSVLALPAGNAVLGGLSNTLVGKDKLGRVGAGSMVLQYGAYGVAVALAGWGMQTIGYGPTCLILATVLVAAAAYALTMRSLITLPTPDRWAEHIQRWSIAQF
ncbi:MFS transporter [Bifidobacterium breve MCC 1128]|uniref:MFS transporter n=1 Tax=Bifidobacterium breve MCC 1128 TaxID=1365965 RepID=A0A0L7AVW6_BIFBR|nr:MFS transporter [Bifidobacterium breve]KOA39153.1 MFS transporter [Bifidobacterium breve MCC 1128]MDX5145382.1 MFS transporter [Bifidobacterium breve]